MARTPSKKAPAPTDKAPTPGKDAATGKAPSASSTPATPGTDAATPPSPTGDQAETPQTPSNENPTPNAPAGDELAQAPRPGAETDQAAAAANDPARKLAEQRQPDPAAVQAEAEQANATFNPSVSTVSVQLADAVAQLSPQEQAEYYRAKLAELAASGHIDPGDGLAVTMAKKADTAPATADATAQNADELAAILSGQEKAARAAEAAQQAAPRSLEADLARLGQIRDERAKNGPQIDRSVSQAARRTIAQERAEMDAATHRAKVVSGQAYGGLVGGQYALNPADATNRARVALGVPAAPDTGAAVGTAGVGAGAASGQPVPTAGTLPAGAALAANGSPMVMGPVGPVPVVPGPSIYGGSGSPAPTATTGAASMNDKPSGG